jgi:hypothetical protein
MFNDPFTYCLTFIPVQVYTLLGMDILLCVLAVLTAGLCLSKLYWSHAPDNITPSKQVTEVEDKVIGEAR